MAGAEEVSTVPNDQKAGDHAGVLLGIVVVDYRSAKRTIDFVTNELSKISVAKRIAIVNNSCTPDSNATLALGCGGKVVNANDSVDYDCQVFVIGAKENLGYARGNNVGAKFLREHFDVPYILFTNNDLVLNNGDVVEQLIKVAERHVDVGAIGPRVIGPEGRDQSPMKYCNIWMRIILPYGLYPLLYPFLRVGLLSDIVQGARCGYYYRLMGCFILAKAGAFETVKGFDEGTFLYAEEMILSERMGRQGLKMYYDPCVAVTHEHRQVTSQHMSGMRAMQLRLESETYFYKKYRNISRFEEMCSRWALSLFLNVYSPFTRFVKKKLFPAE